MPWHEIDVIDLYLNTRADGECEIWTGPLIAGIPQARFRGVTVDARQLAYFCYDDDVDERYYLEWPWVNPTCGNDLCCRRSHLKTQQKGNDLLALYRDTIAPLPDAIPTNIIAALAGRPARPLR